MNFMCPKEAATRFQDLTADKLVKKANGKASELPSKAAFKKYLKILALQSIASQFFVLFVPSLFSF